MRGPSEAGSGGLLAPATGLPGPPWRRWLREGADGLLDLLFPLPAGCAFCRGPVAGEGPGRVCDRCRDEVFLDTSDVCRKCGRPQPGATGLCQACWRTYPPFGRARAVGPYLGRLREAVLRLKAGGETWLAEPLADLMAARLRAEFFPPDLVVPVPAHPRKRRERGFDQARLLAAALCRRLDLPLAAHALARRDDALPQAGLSGVARIANAAAAFHPAGPARVHGRRILLVDDIYTTGATAAASPRRSSWPRARPGWTCSSWP